MNRCCGDASPTKILPAKSNFYFTQGAMDKNGGLIIRAPKGLKEAKLSLITNEHAALRVHMAKDKPLSNQHRDIDLGTLENDVRGIEAIRYEAPILLVKPAAEDGSLLRDAKVEIEYAKNKGIWNSQGRYVEGKDVSFEKQDDGRRRSGQLLPDEEFTVTVKAEGYEPKSEKLKLPEGEVKELEVQLKKALGRRLCWRLAVLLSPHLDRESMLQFPGQGAGVELHDQHELLFLDVLGHSTRGLAEAASAKTGCRRIQGLPAQGRQANLRAGMPRGRVRFVATVTGLERQVIARVESGVDGDGLAGTVLKFVLAELRVQRQIAEKRDRHATLVLHRISAGCGDAGPVEVSAKGKRPRLAAGRILHYRGEFIGGVIADRRLDAVVCQVQLGDRSIAAHQHKIDVQKIALALPLRQRQLQLARALQLVQRKPFAQPVGAHDVTLVLHLDDRRHGQAIGEWIPVSIPFPVHPELVERIGHAAVAVGIDAADGHVAALEVAACPRYSPPWRN